MAITLVGQAGIAGGQADSPATITYASTAGNTLIITGHLYDVNNGAFVAPTSVTDTASNVWQVSVSATQAPFTAQTPPTCSITDPSDGGSSHMADWVAWCVSAKAVTSVTLAWAGGVSTWRRVALSEWSGIVQFASSWAGGSASTSASVTSGPVTVPVSASLVVGALDFGGSGTESVPSGWTQLTGAGSVGNNAYTLSAAPGPLSPVWTNTTADSWAGALAVFSPSPLNVLPIHQPVRARITQPPRGHRHATTAAVAATPAPPATGPPFSLPGAPARARVPQNAPRGRVHKNAGAPVNNPVTPATGPPVYPIHQPARTRITLPPRGHRHTSPGAPVNNPTSGPVIPVLMGPAGIRVVYVRTGHAQSLASPPPPTPAPVYPLPGPARARQPLPPRGRTHKNPGAPVHNPTPGPPFPPLQRAVRARPPLPPRGRTTGNNGAPVANPVTGAGPPFYPLRQPARARIVPPPHGHAAGGKGAPLANPTTGPVFRQATQPARARIPQAFSKGRAGGNPGTPPPSVAPFRLPAKATRAQPAVFLKGRATGSQGAPVIRPAPPAAPPPPLRQPARTRITLPPRGRATGNAGAPVQNPVIHPAQFFPPAKALRAQPPVFLKGRIASSPGAPVHNPTAGPKFTLPAAPSRIRITLPPRGRTASNAGGPVSNPVPPPFQPPGMVTVTPAGPLAAQVTVTSGHGIPVVVPYTYGAVPGIAVPGLMVPGLVGALYIPFPAPTGASATVTPAGANAATVSITQA